MSEPRQRWALSPENKVDAREALRVLDGSGLTLTEAAQRAVAGKLAVERVLFRVAADRFMLQLVRSKPRPSTLRWYENKLAVMIEKLGELPMDSIARMDILRVGDEQDVVDATRCSYYRAIRAVWRWARATEPPLVGVDVTEGLPTSARTHEGKVTGILTVSDTAAVLGVPEKHRSAIALMLFAGLRPDELWGKDKPPLLWRHVLIQEKIIRVPADIAKTRTPRVIEGLPDTVWHWLQPKAPDQQVSLVASNALIRAAQVAGGFSAKVDGQHRVYRAWPYDGTRHSFATYALGLTADPGKVSLWLGHEGDPRMLYTHYRGLCTKAEAEAYFALRPLPPA